MQTRQLVDKLKFACYNANITTRKTLKITIFNSKTTKNTRTLKQKSVVLLYFCMYKYEKNEHMFVKST